MTDLLIIGLLIWFWCWDLPRDLPARKALDRVHRPFVWLGLWHSWAMFAPEPLHVNRRLKAVLTCDDGSLDEWRPIEPRRSNWLLDLLWFRHFKFQFSVLSGSNRCLWQPLCDWLIRQAAADGHRIVRVQLVREYQIVQPPGSEFPLTGWRSVVIHECPPTTPRGTEPPRVSPARAALVPPGS